MFYPCASAPAGGKCGAGDRASGPAASETGSRWPASVDVATSTTTSIGYFHRYPAASRLSEDCCIGLMGAAGRSRGPRRRRGRHRRHGPDGGTVLPRSGKATGYAADASAGPSCRPVAACERIDANGTRRNLAAVVAVLAGWRRSSTTVTNPQVCETYGGRESAQTERGSLQRAPDSEASKRFPESCREFRRIHLCRRESASLQAIPQWAIQDSNLGPLPYQRSALTD